MITAEQPPDEVMDEILDEKNALIDRLTAENEKLRAALKQIAGMDPWDDGEQGYVDKARAALGFTPLHKETSND